MSKRTLRDEAIAALKANNGVVERLHAAGPKGQYKAVGAALASSVARRQGVATHTATWALVNAYNDSFCQAAEDINEDY